MIDASSRDGRLNFLTAVKQLIEANYAINADGSRMTFATRAEKENFLEKKMNEIDLREVTQGYLWMSTNVIPARQQLQFTVVDTQQVAGSPVTPFNSLLTMQDSFLVSTLFYGVTNYSYTDGPSTLASPDFTVGNNWEPVTYASYWLNNGFTVGWDPGVSMLWIGAYLTVTVNKKVLIPKWDCFQHFKVPICQSTPNIVSPSAYIPYQKNSLDGSVDGFVYMQPNIVIGGGRGNDIKLTLPANVPAGIAPFNSASYNVAGTGFILQAVVITRGILMQNSTNVK